MSQLEKAINRIKTCPKDYTYDEARHLLSSIGYKEHNKGKTSGSRVVFIRDDDKIMLHKSLLETSYANIIIVIGRIINPIFDFLLKYFLFLVY